MVLWPLPLPLPASTGVCSSQQRKGLRMLAQKAALPPLPINWGQTGEGIAGARDKADSCLETPTPPQAGESEGLAEGLRSWEHFWAGLSHPATELNLQCYGPTLEKPQNQSLCRRGHIPASEVTCWSPAGAWPTSSCSPTACFPTPESEFFYQLLKLTFPFSQFSCLCTWKPATKHTFS